jgi:hypothetical protein
VGRDGGSGEPFSSQPCIFKQSKEPATPSKKQTQTQWNIQRKTTNKINKTKNKNNMYIQIHNKNHKTTTPNEKENIQT